MTIDYAHTPTATEQRQVKAKALARWCYHRGVTAAALTSADSATRRQLAHRAEVLPPRECPGPELAETWQLVVELLTQRHMWDEAHRRDAPAAPIQCLPCLIVFGCQLHRHGRACTACGLPLHRVIIIDGYSTHPACEPIPASRDTDSGPADLPAVELDTPLY